MKKGLLYLTLGLGWIILAISLVSGFYYNKFSNGAEHSTFRPIEWNDHMQLFEGVLQCSLSDTDLIERKKVLKEKIFSKVINKEETHNGFVYHFDYNESILNDILDFTKKEKSCCPFFKFDISILPFDHGLAVQLSGSEEVVEILADFETNEF